MFGYQVTENKQYNSIEVRFVEKPSEAIRRAFKLLRMRWSPKNQCWYGYATKEEIYQVITAANA